MKTIIAATAVACLLGAGSAQAQGWQGFAIAGVGSMTGGRPFDNPGYMDHNPEVSIGVLYALGSRFAAGVQGDLTVNNGYPGGRGGPIAEFDLVSRGRALRPFLKGGYFYGVNGSQAGVGAGVDLLAPNGIGVRVAVQDAFNVARTGLDCARIGFDPAACAAIGGGVRTTVQHEPSLQIGFSWR